MWGSRVCRSLLLYGLQSDYPEKMELDHRAKLHGELADIGLEMLPNPSDSRSR